MLEKDKEELLNKLKSRFEKNMNRHKDLVWKDILIRLLEKSKEMDTLWEMEKTGGEPDVVEFDKKNGKYIFFDCSEESPTGRRNVCYDREALDSRKKFKPRTSALDMATAMGVEILTEEEYRELQQFGNFDKKTSNWLKTPTVIRRLGGAIFADRRYDQVFVYHNGADSYYAARGFRGKLKV